MRYKRLLSAAALAATLFASEASAQDCTKTVSVPCPLDAVAFSALSADKEANFDFIVEVEEEIRKLRIQVKLLEDLVKALESKPDGMSPEKVAEEVGPLRLEIERLSKELEGLGPRVTALEAADVATAEQIRLLWINWKTVTDSVATLEKDLKAIDVPRMKFIVGPYVGFEVGSPIAPVTYVSGPRNETTEWSQGVGQIRTGYGLAAGLEWSNSVSGLALLGRVGDRSDDGIEGSVSIVRFAKLSNNWAIGGGAGVSGASYEFLGRPHPGSVQIGGDLEGFVRGSLELVNGGYVDLTLVPSVGIGRLENADASRIGFNGGAILKVGGRF